MKFRNETGRYIVTAAADNASRLLSPLSRMLEDLRTKNDWKYGVVSGEQVYETFMDCEKVLPVRIYRPKWCFSKAIGYFDGDAIYLNRYKLDGLSNMQLVGLLCHEYSHAAGFNHGLGLRANYKTRDKVKYSVPYFISENIGRWL